MSTKERPGVFDCHGNALPREEMFTLLARDPAAADTVRHWAALRCGRGLNKPDDPQIREALQCADRMDLQMVSIKQELRQQRQAIACPQISQASQEAGEKQRAEERQARSEEDGPRYPSDDAEFGMKP